MVFIMIIWQLFLVGLSLRFPEKNTKGLDSKWLLEHLKMNDWLVRKNHALNMIHRLKSATQSPSMYNNVELEPHNKVYYQSIKVWIPEDIFGRK